MYIYNIYIKINKYKINLKIILPIFFFQININISLIIYRIFY
jgi:hypothetical protein